MLVVDLVFSGKKYIILFILTINDFAFWFCLKNLKKECHSQGYSANILNRNTDHGGGGELIYLQSGSGRMRSCRVVDHLLHLIPRTVGILAKNYMIITGARGQGNKTITWRGSLLHPEENNIKTLRWLSRIECFKIRIIREDLRFKWYFSLYRYWNLAVILFN